MLEVVPYSLQNLIGKRIGSLSVAGIISVVHWYVGIIFAIKISDKKDDCYGSNVSSFIVGSNILNEIHVTHARLSKTEKSPNSIHQPQKLCYIFRNISAM